MPSTRRVIVTRPAREAQRWVAESQAMGLDAVALPLIVIDKVADDTELRAVRERLADWSALMFVSAAAAAHFFEGVSLDGSLPRCWATGPGTVRGLREAGVPAARIDAPSGAADQFDSETLWADVRAQVGPGTPVLIVRGGNAAGQPIGRGWLAQEIEAAGGRIDTVVAYRRLAPVLAEAQRQLASVAATDGSVWLFSSSEAIANLCAALPALRWDRARAVATHPRIGAAARAAGFGSVQVAPPGQAALIASIESFA
jgi:uroporphyrinogen-III synthase